MKSCFGLLLVLLVIVAVLGTGGLIFYLSSTAEFSRKDGATPAAAHSSGPAPAPARPAVPPRPR